jgi:CRP-like cAMP-binding protein
MEIQGETGMTSESFVEVLRQVELLQGLSDSQLEEIDRKAERVTFKTADTIIAEDQAGDAAYIILAGEAVRTSSTQEGTFVPVPLQALVGEMAMLIETSHSATVSCRSPVQALKLARGMMHAQMASDPDLAEHLVEKIAARLRHVAEMLRKVDEAIAEAPRHLHDYPIRLRLPSAASSEAELRQ